MTKDKVRIGLTFLLRVGMILTGSCSVSFFLHFSFFDYSFVTTMTTTTDSNSAFIPPCSSFEISSDALCFGSRNEVKEGASQPPHFVDFASGGGTVLQHQYDYNLAAVSGTWNVFRIQEEAPNRITSAFCCHHSISPHDEAKRILQVANSPYEEDDGTSRNTEKTRVLVINRYDWVEDYFGRWH